LRPCGYGRKFHYKRLIPFMWIYPMLYKEAGHIYLLEMRIASSIIGDKLTVSSSIISLPHLLTFSTGQKTICPL